MRWLVWSACLLVVGLFNPHHVNAKLCGDDVDGQDVPCACGDTVVSSVVLGSDPVVGATCTADGLIVRAVGAARGVTVDLAGKTLRGNGHGTGVWVVYGGPGGARIISSGGTATLDGFRDGVMSAGPDSVHLIQGLRARASVRDGIRVHTDHFEIRDSEALASGRDGFSLGGSGYVISASQSRNSGRSGYLIMGTNANLGLPGAGITADGSATFGFNIMGAGHSLVDCMALENGKDGVKLGETNYEIKGCVAEGNGGDGITGTGMNWQMSRNRANNNNNNGIVAKGAGVQDDGGNSGSGNLGSLERHPAVQCEINGVPCRP